MIPALAMRVSSMLVWERMLLAPVWTEARDARSIEMNVMGTEGDLALWSVMSSSARDSEPVPVVMLVV